MFDNFRYITTNMRNTLLALALLGGSVATQAAEKDSLTIADYFYLEGLRQQEMGNLTAAYDLLRHAHDLNPRSAAVYYQLAGYYVNMKNDALARTYFEKAASLRAFKTLLYSFKASFFLPFCSNQLPNITR